MAVHTDGSFTASEQRRLADVRRFLSPYEQQLVEETLRHLAEDRRLPPGAADAALHRTLAARPRPKDFCPRLAEELRALELHGPAVEGPEEVGLALSIDAAFERWLSDAGRKRLGDAAGLARALRDGETRAEDFETSAWLDTGERPLFLTDAASFEPGGASAARIQCLTGPPSRSYVVAVISTARLRSALRIPTAADAVCRPDFQLAPADAPAGLTCSGHPEYVTTPHTLDTATRFHLSR
jgi:hypothetical protein